MSCRWNGLRNPRTIAGRHGEDCQGLDCPGCQPCTEPHCRVCGRTHADGTCAECMAATRETLFEIARMCDALPEEVESRGIAGEAMMLLGPVVDPEAWGHVSASVASGRLPADWIEGGGELHPATVLLTWQMVWRDALEHDEAPDAELATAVDYLDRTMSYMGGYEHVPFEDFARDVRRCSGHLEAVLHDGEQVERGAPCLACGRQMTKSTGDGGNVTYDCLTCHRRVPEAQYRYAVGVAYRAHADRLPITDLADRLGIPASTIRRWASSARGNPPLLRSCGVNASGVKVYRVSAVEDVRDSMQGEESA